MRYDFYAYLDRMKYIRRWQLMRSQRDENIMEHSQSVAMLAHALAVIRNKVFGGNVNVEKTVLYAMYHEISEVLTGDLPTPIKYYNHNIRNAYKDLERSAAERCFCKSPEDDFCETGICEDGRLQLDCRLCYTFIGNYACRQAGQYQGGFHRLSLLYF
jgi:5'-deoxynucleotidase